jgi:hypothetical protein
MQSVNNKSLIEELDKLLEQLNIPSEVCLYVVNFLSLSLMNLIYLIIIFNEFPFSVVFSIFDRRII